MSITQDTRTYIIFSVASMYAREGFINGNVLNVVPDILSEHEKLRSSWRKLKYVTK